MVASLITHHLHQPQQQANNRKDGASGSSATRNTPDWSVQPAAVGAGHEGGRRESKKEGKEKEKRNIMKGNNHAGKGQGGEREIFFFAGSPVHFLD